jgi:hypothetical protein
MNKRLQTIIELYENTFKVTPLKKSGAFTLLTPEGVSCGVFSTEEEAIRAMPVVAYNTMRGYVPANLLKKRPAHVKFVPRPQSNQVSKK